MKFKEFNTDNGKIVVNLDQVLWAKPMGNGKTKLVFVDRTDREVILESPDLLTNFQAVQG